MASALVDSNLHDMLPFVARGKVRDLYSLDDDALLFVATDRISAFDVVMANGIPEKGALLTQLSAHWFSLLTSQIPGLRTHLRALGLPSSVSAKLPRDQAAQLQTRSMQVQRFKIFPLEAIVRGYITGSAWKEYCEKGTVHGMLLSRADGQRFRESEKLERPVYTPSTKAEVGEKDENIHPDEAARIVGEKYAKRIEELSLQLYTKARDYALERGIIIADTKFEFGLDTATDEVVLVDEVLTPDSSRFWPVDGYRVGQAQDSFDKQHLRDWLTSEGLKGKQGVVMSEEIAQKTSDMYREAFERLTGRKWETAVSV